MQSDKVILVIIILVCIIVGVISANLKHEEETLNEKIYESGVHIKQDYEKVLRVLDSCKNREQLEAAERMIMCFKNKHRINEDSCRPLYVMLNEILGKKYKELS